MHPYIAQNLAAARARELHKRSAETSRAKQARRGRADSAARRLLRRIAAVAECRYARRRATALRTSADTYTSDPGGAPENYREFLLRTSGPLRHEPSAAHRRAGQPVR